MFHTPEPKRNQQRPPKKGHKTKQDEDIKGVGVIRGEVTPESRSADDDPGLMRANAATRHERSLGSGPSTHFGQGSSNQAEGAQVDRVIGYGPREQAIPAGDSDDTPMQLQNPLLSADDQLGAFKEAAL